LIGGEGLRWGDATRRGENLGCGDPARVVGDLFCKSPHTGVTENKKIAITMKGTFR
tara:strand:+ start:404 stop:571 length:168 start_codon:yes stop_codon:yes gene_type:complete